MRYILTIILILIAATANATGYGILTPYATTSILEAPSNTSVPATCNVGELYIDTNSTAGIAIEYCYATNTWKHVGEDVYLLLSGGTLTGALVTAAAGIEVGHATDSTLTRASAGDLNIEGNIIYRAGGTDVPDGDMADAHSHAADAIDAITEIAAALKTGADTTLVTGTAGTAGYCVEYDANGDLVEAASGAPCGSGGSGDNVTVNSTAADTTANFLDSLYIDFSIADGGAGGPDDVTATHNYGITLAGNPALNVDECVIGADTSGGFILCEGSTADTNEQIYRFPNVNGADTDENICIAGGAFHDGFSDFASNEHFTQANITATGTIATGTWEATDVGVAHGGTGKSSWTQYLIPYADTTTSFSQIAIGTSGQVLTSAGAGSAPAFETLSIAAGEYAAASIDGDDVNSNIAGRSLTLNAASPDTLDADAELYTDSKCLYLETPVDADDLEAIWWTNIPVTMTAIYCEVDAGTITLDLEVDDGTPAGVNGSTISCAVGGTTDTSFAGDTALVAGETLDLEITTVTTAVKLTVCWEYTKDD